jgi:hypothetical protein
MEQGCMRTKIQCFVENSKMHTLMKDCAHEETVLLEPSYGNRSIVLGGPEALVSHMRALALTGGEFRSPHGCGPAASSRAST